MRAKHPARHINTVTSTVAIWVQLQSILCQTRLSRSFVIFNIRALLSPERQSALMSKIANDRLNLVWHGMLYSCPPYGNSGRQRVKEQDIWRAALFQLLVNLFDYWIWLPVPQRIQFRIATLTFDCVRGTGPAYFSSTVADNSGRPSSAENHDLHELKQLGLEGGASSSHLQLSGTLTAARLIFSLNRLVDRRWSWYF